MTNKSTQQYQKLVKPNEKCSDLKTPNTAGYASRFLRKAMEEQECFQ